jgi:hypothetical protein
MAVLRSSIVVDLMNGGPEVQRRACSAQNRGDGSVDASSQLRPTEAPHGTQKQKSLFEKSKSSLPLQDRMSRNFQRLQIADKFIGRL